MRITILIKIVEFQRIIGVHVAQYTYITLYKRMVLIETPAYPGCRIPIPKYVCALQIINVFKTIWCKKRDKDLGSGRRAGSGLYEARLESTLLTLNF